MKRIFTLIIATVFCFGATAQTRLWAKYCGTTNFDDAHRLGKNASIVSICGFKSPASPEGFWQNYSYSGTLGNSHITVGGTSTDFVACDLDAAGNIYVLGYTNITSGLTTPGVYQQTYGGGNYDLIIQKYNSSGTLVWGTYYGGISDEYSGLSGIKLDNAGNIYIATSTYSSNAISTVGSFQPTNAGGADGVIAKFNPNGTLAWGTYYGGGQDDIFTSIDLDASGNIYASGYFNSPGLSFNGYQSVCTTETSFLAKFDNSGNRLWSTYFGAGGRSIGVKCNNAGTCVYMTGFSTSSTYIPYNGFQMTYGGGSRDGFIVKFNSTGTRVWGSYLGGSGLDQCTGVAVDALDNVFTSGVTNSATGISFNGFQNTIGGGYDGIILKLDSAGTRIYSSYYGGSLNDAGTDVIIDSQNDMYICGYASSTSGIATTGSNNGGQDGFIAKFSNPCVIPSQPTSITGPTTVCNGATNNYSITAVSGATSYTWVLPGGWTGTSTATSINATANSTGGTISVTANNACGSSTAQTLVVSVNNMSVTVPSTAVLCNGDCNGILNCTPTGTGPFTYVWSPGNQTAQNLSGLCAGSYTLTVTGAGGCTAAQSSTVNQPTVLSATPSSTFTTCGTCCDGTASVLASGGTPNYTFLWSPGGQITANATGLCNGTYTVCVTDVNLCTTCSTVNVSFNVNSQQLTTYNEQLFSIYPNPFNENISIQINNLNGIAVAEIFNVLGENIFKQMITNTKTEINLSKIESGIYFMRITTSWGSVTKKIIKE